MIVRYQQGGQTVSIAFDATIREVHTAGSTVTTHPVEQGSDIADHVQISQPRLSIEGVVTNAPLSTPGSNMDGVTGSVRGLSLDVPDSEYITFGLTTVKVPRRRQVGAQVFQFSDRFDRVKAVVAAMIDVVESARLVSITNGLREYEDMVIVNLSAPRETQDACTFTFDAVHVDFVETQTVAAPKRVRKNRGNKGAKEAKPETKEYESFAHRLKDWAAGALGR